MDSTTYVSIPPAKTTPAPRPIFLRALQGMMLRRKVAAASRRDSEALKARLAPEPTCAACVTPLVCARDSRCIQVQE